MKAEANLFFILACTEEFVIDMLVTGADVDAVEELLFGPFNSYLSTRTRSDAGYLKALPTRFTEHVQARALAV